MRQRLKAAAFPYQKRLEDFDFSLIPCVSKVRLLELAQGAFLTGHDNVLFIGPSGIGKTHLLMGLGRALCLAGYRVLFRSAVMLATELEVAHKELRLPRLLAHYRRFDLILVDELGCSHLSHRLFHTFRVSHLRMRVIYPSRGKHFISQYYIPGIPHLHVVFHNGLVRFRIHSFFSFPFSVYD